MDLRFSPEDEAFRAEARDWLTERLSGEFAGVRGRGGPGDEHSLFEERLAWERALGDAGWTCLSWPREYGGRDVTLLQQVIFYEEYARAGGPGRVGLVGEGLIGPTILHFGTDEQRARFLPRIASGEELWCQGYSEPNAGSDLANISTRAVLDGDEWVIDGQKVWTSLAHWSQWCFVLARTDRDAPRHRGISYLLVPMDQPGIEIRPIEQITGTSEFNEVFFDGARTPAENVVGEVNGGWKVAMGTLAFERGALTLGQQLWFVNEWHEILATARERDVAADPVLRQRLAQAWIELEIMRYTALRGLTAMAKGEVTRETSISKLFWASLHRRLGRARDDRARPVVPDWRRGALRPEPGATDLPLHPRRHDLRRLQPDSAQRDRRAGARPAARTQGGLMEANAAHGLLAGKSVLVTAAAGTGIGFATAERCIAEGATVVISDAHERRLAESAEQLGTEHSVVCDVTDQAQVDAMLAYAEAAIGPLDIVVNNAGLGGTANLVDMTDEQWAKVLDVTLTGTFRCVRSTLQRMQARGSGVIVNNASVLGWRAQAGQAHYAAAKAGVMALTRCAAVEAAEFGVRVNAVAPSLAMHPFLAKVTTDEVLEELTAREAFGRAAEPWEVANVIVFLASDYSTYMTGEVVSVSSQHP